MLLSQWQWHDIPAEVSVSVMAEDINMMSADVLDQSGHTRTLPPIISYLGAIILGKDRGSTFFKSKTMIAMGGYHTYLVEFSV